MYKSDQNMIVKDHKTDATSPRQMALLAKTTPLQYKTWDKKS